MPRPKLYPVKKVVGFDHAMLLKIEDWRRQQTPIPSVSDAIRRILESRLSAGDPLVEGYRREMEKHRSEISADGELEFWQTVLDEMAAEPDESVLEWFDHQIQTRLENWERQQKQIKRRKPAGAAASKLNASNET